MIKENCLTHPPPTPPIPGLAPPAPLSGAWPGRSGAGKGGETVGLTEKSEKPLNQK